MNEWNGPNYCVKDGRARAPHTWWTIELFNLSKNFARAALNVKEKKKNSSWFFLKKETTIQIVYARPLVSNNTKFKWGRAPPSTSCRARIPIHGSPLFLPPGALLLTDYSVIPPKCVCIARSKKGGGHLTFMGILECKFFFILFFTTEASLLVNERYRVKTRTPVSPRRKIRKQYVTLSTVRQTIRDGVRNTHRVI